MFRGRSSLLAVVSTLIVPGTAVAELPDLDQLAPQHVEAVATSDGDGTRHELIFTAATKNVGAGELRIEAERAGDSMPAVQMVDGEEPHPLPALEWAPSEHHDHYHLRRFALYELLGATGTDLGIGDRKTGFCLTALNGYVTGSTVPVGTDSCAKDDQGATHVTMGISPGREDVYKSRLYAGGPILDGQAITLPDDLPAGRYLLRHTADPDALLRETTRENNAASTLIELTRAAGGEPVARTIASCPATPTCSEPPPPPPPPGQPPPAPPAPPAAPAPAAPAPAASPRPAPRLTLAAAARAARRGVRHGRSATCRRVSAIKAACHVRARRRVVRVTVTRTKRLGKVVLRVRRVSAARTSALLCRL